MIHSISKTDKMSLLFRPSWVYSMIEERQEVVIKINLARPPEENHPRTDSALLKATVQFFLDRDCKIIICESADGYLKKNLLSLGFGWMNMIPEIQIMDLDEVEYDIVSVNGQKIAIPTLFNDTQLKISIPCTSKREGMLFSSNVKNFFGATPREIYLREGDGRWRSRLHDDLTQSVMNVYNAFERFAHFDLYVNGGKAHKETIGDFELNKVYISDNGVELDRYLFERYYSDLKMPEYLKNLIYRIDFGILEYLR